MNLCFYSASDVSICNVFTSAALSDMPTTAPTVKPTCAPTLNPSIVPTARPSVNPSICTYGCIILSGQEPISLGYRLAYVSLPRLFRISFTVKALTIPTGALKFNILELSDAYTGANLLAIHVGADLSLTVQYNGTVVVDNGPRLAATYASSFTSVSIEVNQDTLSVLTADTGVWAQYPIPTHVFTVDQPFVLYTSSPNYISTQGFINSLAITGNLFMCVFSLIARKCTMVSDISGCFYLS